MAGRADQCPGLPPPPKRLCSMDLRSSRQAPGPEKLCFSRPGSREGVVQAGAAAQLADQGPLAPTLAFPLRPRPCQARKYPPWPRKTFPRRGPDVDSHSHPRQLFLQEPPAPDVLREASEWDTADPPVESGKGQGKVGPAWGSGDQGAGRPRAHWPLLSLASTAAGAHPTDVPPPPWTPALPPSEVTVTDITANSITVTFREAQAAEGFFRDRGGSGKC